MSRELVVLGTSSQVPTRHRNHNGYLLRWDGEGILFDPGEGTPAGRRMLPERLESAGVSGPDVGRLLREGSLQVGGRLVRLDDVSEERAPQRMAFVMDTAPCESAVLLASGVDLLVCESPTRRPRRLWLGSTGT